LYNNHFNLRVREISAITTYKGKKTRIACEIEVQLFSNVDGISPIQKKNENDKFFFKEKRSFL
jgi:hypothetical protein